MKYFLEQFHQEIWNGVNMHYLIIGSKLKHLKCL
jgi:hypothetical protein